MLGGQSRSSGGARSHGTESFRVSPHEKVSIPESFTIRLGVAKELRDGGEVMMMLEVDYETVMGELWPTRISMRGSNEGDHEGCLEISLQAGQSSLYIASLLRGPTPQECEAWRVGQDTNREGVGRAVMEAVATIADQLFEKDVLLYLQDASAFTVRNAPLLDVSMTTYLRMARGFGFYEGLGYADEQRADQQRPRMKAVRESVRQWHEALFATPLRQVEGRMRELYGQDLRLLEKAQRAVKELVVTKHNFVDKYADWSVRGLVQYLERESKPVDPRNDAVPPDMPTPTSLRAEWATRLERANPDAADVLGFLNGLDMTKLLYEGSQNFFQKWLTQVPGGHSHLLVTSDGVVQETVSRDGLRLAKIQCYRAPPLARQIRDVFFDGSVALV